jgi:WD40 repeat protein
MIGFIVVLGLLVACLPTEPEVTQVVQPPEQTTETRPRPSLAPTLTATLNAAAITLPTASPTKVPTSAPTSIPSSWQKIAEWPVNDAAFAPYFELSDDGTLLATTDLETGILYIFDTTTWKLLWEIDEPNRGLTSYSLDFSPDGTLLAGSGSEQDIYVWDMQTGERKYFFDNPYYSVNSVTFSLDGKLLAVSTPEARTYDRVTIWNLESRQPLSYQLKATDYGWYVSKIGFVPNQPYLLAITAANINFPEDWREDFKPGGLYFWDIESDFVYEAITGTVGLGIVISSSGEHVIASIDDNLRIWDVNQRSEPFQLMAESSPLAVTNTRIVGVEADSHTQLSVWDLSGDLIGILDTKYPVYDAAFLPNGDLVVAYFVEDVTQVFEVWRLNN